MQVILEFRNDETRLSVLDDGAGFVQLDEAEWVRQGHFGLIGMRERAQLLGAEFTLNSSATDGTAVNVSVPTT